MTKLHLMLAAGALAMPLALGHPVAAADPAGVDADNTKRNAKDADGGTLTPMDQGGSAADRTITQQIRKAVTTMVGPYDDRRRHGGRTS